MRRALTVLKQAFKLESEATSQQSDLTGSDCGAIYAQDVDKNTIQVFIGQMAEANSWAKYQQRQMGQNLTEISGNERVKESPFKLRLSQDDCVSAHFCTL